MVPRAVEPKTREDEPKISAGLAKIADEDPTFTYRRDAQTHELVISGMSELHLDVIQHRLKNRFKLDINTHVPHVPYLETITGDGRGPPPPQEADRRPRPVRRRPAPHPAPGRAARGSTSSTRSRGA